MYNPADAEVFLPRLLPVLDAASSSVADPEVRAVVAVAHKGLDDLHAAAISGANAQARPAVPPSASAPPQHRPDSREDRGGFCTFAPACWRHQRCYQHCGLQTRDCLVADPAQHMRCMVFLQQPHLGCLRVPPPTSAAAARKGAERCGGALVRRRQ